MRSAEPRRSGHTLASHAVSLEIRFADSPIARFSPCHAILSRHDWRHGADAGELPLPRRLL